MRRPSLLSLIPVFLSGCLGVESIEVSPAEVTFISLDQQEVLKPTPKDGKGKLVAGAIRDLEWTSSDPKVVEVSPVGAIKTVGFGEAEVRVSVGGKTGVTKVRVAKPAKVVIDPPSFTMVGAHDTRQLSAKVFDDKGVEIPTRIIVWSVSDKNLLEIEAGLVKSVNVGEGKVIAKCLDAVGEAAVKVTYPRVAKLVCDPSTLELDVGGQVGMPIMGYATDGKPLQLIPVKFKSNKPKIVSIDANGILTGLKRGKAVVSAIADGQRADAKVMVY